MYAFYFIEEKRVLGDSILCTAKQLGIGALWGVREARGSATSGFSTLLRLPIAIVEKNHTVTLKGNISDI
jgi:hypothetical protein